MDELLKQSGVFRDNQEVTERVMDSNDIERERGITILSKNTAVRYGTFESINNKNNTIYHLQDTFYFTTEISMSRSVDNVDLCLTITLRFSSKFVLKKALELNLSVIVCVNKCDRPEATPVFADANTNGQSS